MWTTRRSLTIGSRIVEVELFGDFPDVWLTVAIRISDGRGYKTVLFSFIGVLVQRLFGWIPMGFH